jgi:uncharacterized membrane protein
VHSGREDTGRATSDALVLLAAVASLAAVALLLAAGSSGPRKDLFAALGVASVALAWATVHTLFTTRYANVYSTGRVGGIEFNEPGPPLLHARARPRTAHPRRSAAPQRVASYGKPIGYCEDGALERMLLGIL